MTRLLPCMLAVLALALMVAAPAIAQKEETAVGKIKSVNDAKDQIVVDVKGKSMTFEVDKKAKIRLGTKAAQLKDLKPGAQVAVKYEKEGTKLIAKEITARAGKGGADK